MIKKKHVSIDISIGSIFWILFTLGLIFVLFKLTDVIILLFTTILITLAVCPFVDWLEKYKINRAISAAVILLSILGLFIFSIVSLAQPLIAQTELFLQKLPVIIDTVSPIKFDAASLTPQFSTFPGQVITIALGTFSGFLTTFTVIVMSYYMIQEMHKLKSYMTFWFGAKGERYYVITEKLEQQVGYWVRGEMLLMLIVGTLSYVGYLIIGLPFALPLAFIAGMLELIPNIGPTVATIPAVLVGLSISPGHGLAALVVSIIVQQLENNVIVPKVMQKVIGLNPVVIILAIMTGFQLGGPLTAILALPIVLTARVILGHVRLNKYTTIPELD